MGVIRTLCILSPLSSLIDDFDIVRDNDVVEVSIVQDKGDLTMLDMKTKMTNVTNSLTVYWNWLSLNQSQSQKHNHGGEEEDD